MDSYGGPPLEDVNSAVLLNQNGKNLSCNTTLIIFTAEHSLLKVLQKSNKIATIN